MKSRIRPLLALVSVAFAGGCDQPATPCVLADAHPDPSISSPGTPYLLVYYFRQRSQTGQCADDPSDFASRIYEESYPSPDGGPSEVAWTPDEFAYDPQSGEPPDPNHVPTIRGRFTAAVPDADGLCFVEGTLAGQQEIDGSLVTYEFKRVQVLATASVQGTEILADVVVTRGSCSREYDALGIWPPVSCTSAVECDPYPAPEQGRPFGSGLVPALPVECNTGPLLVDEAGRGACFFPDAGPAGFPFLTGK
jgi:hypothetical protein